MQNLMLFVEGSSVPGCAMEMNLNESTDRGLTKFKGKFQEAEAVNKNKRIYPFGILDMNVKALQEAIKARGLVGELDHPTDSIVHFEKVSHVVTKLYWEGNNLMGEGEILNTPHGKILKALLSDGVRVGISSRGVGNGTSNENGIFVIGESYKLITFDAVADPSTYAAYQKVTKENNTTEEIVKTAVKNESKRIHNLNKDAILACLNGIVHEQVKGIKTKL